MDIVDKVLDILARDQGSTAGNMYTTTERELIGAKITPEVRQYLENLGEEDLQLACCGAQEDTREGGIVFSNGAERGSPDYRMIVVPLAVSGFLDYAFEEYLGDTSFDSWGEE